MRLHRLLLFVACALVLSGCGGGKSAPEGVVTFPLDNLDGVIAQSGVTFDSRVSSDGSGSLRIAADVPTTVQLFEISDPDIENAVLLYQAKLRTRDLVGQAYLEMWCHFPGQGEFFSRDLASPIVSDVDWSTEETPFFLKRGENPDRVRLNLVVSGSGTVWIDDIRLLKAPLGEIAG